MDDKELALAINFKNAPVELQTAATAHYANIKAIAKLREKLTQTNLDLVTAEKSAEVSAKVLRKALADWTPVA